MCPSPLLKQISYAGLDLDHFGIGQGPLLGPEGKRNAARFGPGRQPLAMVQVEELNRSKQGLTGLPDHLQHPRQTDMLPHHSPVPSLGDTSCAVRQ